MSNSSSSVYYLGPLHWSKQLNNFSLSCPWAFGLTLFTAAQLGIKCLLFVSHFHFFLILGLLEVPCSLLLVPFSRRGRSYRGPPSQLRGCPLTRNPPRREAFLLPCSQRQETLNQFVPATLLQLRTQVVSVITPVNT